jgi:hypothetical protein
MRGVKARGGAPATAGDGPAGERASYDSARTTSDNGKLTGPGAVSQAVDHAPSFTLAPSFTSPASSEHSKGM